MINFNKTMKKTTCAIMLSLAVSTLLNVNPVRVEAYVPVALLGDITDDGVVDSADYTTFRRYLLGISDTLPNETNADLNFDGSVDSGDYTILRSYLIGKINSLPQLGSEAANTLYHKLANYREEHLSLAQKAKSDRSAVDAFKSVWNSDSRIEQVANDLLVPKEMIQAIIFREQICIGVEDALADQLVKDGVNQDSSTGIGQVTAKTALLADNLINGAGYDLTDPKHFNMMWWNLQEPYSNIYYVGLVLKYETQRENQVFIDEGRLSEVIRLSTATDSQIKTILARYNGWGDGAKIYGEQTFQYYDAFKAYNQSK